MPSTTARTRHRPPQRVFCIVYPHNGVARSPTHGYEVFREHFLGQTRPHGGTACDRYRRGNSLALRTDTGEHCKVVIEVRL
jgi:hypothetical protein